MDTSVRMATAADAGHAAQLLHDFNLEFGDPTPSVPALSRRLTQLIEGGETVLLLGGAGPDCVAVLRFRPAIWSESLECYLAELYVVPHQRGRGLGRALMAAALKTARDRGADTMEINVDEPDLPARRLYESLGFTNRGAGGDLMLFYEREL
jgi:ribosomal protein S18 acetylase RimI-like enzyme